ncbi:MAG: acyl-CoA dehydrogenase family protein [Bacteroidales bacterium]|nr:acyl-CoA dehydrogenase family protein [Bacteroidales bacterium]
MDNKNAIKGGEFIVKETLPEEIFIPEEFDEEARMIAQSCQDFLDTEVMPNLDRLDAHEEGLMPDTLKKAGELGLLGISVPEEYEGFGQNFTTSMLVADTLGAGYAFSVAYSADTGIGTLPIMYYGNEEQKQKYLPNLASGKYLGAYCLTEPGAGSDANSGKTKAVLNDAGTHYILNGSKMWITNGGFADILTVFAKIDEDRILSAFIVERNFPGITFNTEENKMGIKGSSTVQIFFNDCKVPVENLLGTRGEGFRIALNILNLGRIKLGANVIGASKLAINQSVQYANERKQFRTLISNFPAVKYKLAQQVIKAFANETAVYRMSKNVDDAVNRNIANGMDKGSANVEAQREFVIEAALIKVFGSEMLDYVVDEGVQIHGGMGYSAETPIERGYRDSRINRIFEGTNEINRNVTGDTLIKKGLKGEIPLFEEAAKIAENLNKFPENPQFKGVYFEDINITVKNFKAVFLLLVDAAHNNFGKKLSREQEIIFNFSDIIMESYVAESVYLRVKRLQEINGEEAGKIYKDMLNVYLFDSSNIIYKQGLEAIYSFIDEAEQEKYINALRCLTKIKPVNIKEARRRIADKLIEDNKYQF